jgi:putative endonuclease
VTDRRTARQVHGALAEDEAALHLRGLGWQILGRNLRQGRDEIDLLALDPGPPPVVVVVEVRSLVSTRFGAPEEGVDRRKVKRLYRALGALRAGGRDAPGSPTAGLDWRVDLVIVDRRPGKAELRHMMSLEPPG